jgi:O-succinylbenzoic acid--CoA ligase
METLVLNGTTYPLGRLAEVCQHTALSRYERQVLRFAHQWLSGQETFTVETSGSTGTPKAIPLSRAQMLASARLTGQALGLQPGDQALVCVSVEYIAGMMMLVRGFELGLPLTIVDPVSRPLAQFSPDTRFAFTAMVPLQLQETLDGAPHEQEILNRMKGILIGGAAVSRILEERLQQLTAPFYHTYGMTETVSHIALRRLNGQPRSARFVPFAGVQLGQDGRGCLTITGVLTGGATLPTNDLVELHPEGTFRWLGRIDNVINSGGIKVHIEVVEAALETWLMHYDHGAYARRRFFVGSLPDARLGQTVVAVFEGAPFGGGTALSADLTAAIRSTLQHALTPYEIPRQWHFIPQFCETPTGKIDRRANLQWLASQAGEQAP